jgi:hypothetical protein
MAAGLGFKTFTSGEVLTAADTNGYLMQGINVFANASARTAAITSPQEGQYSFLKDTNALEYYDGAAWVGAPVGDITAVTAGKGLTGGGSSGDVTVSLATTAKGDLVAGSGASTAAVLTAGANGETLVADSSTSTGLRYQGSQAAAKNAIINGGFDIWQRGTSIVNPAGGTFLADRWVSAGSNNLTISQETTGAPNGSRYVMRATSTNISSYINMSHYIETSNVAQFWGSTVTVKVLMRRNSTASAGNYVWQLDKSSTVDAGSGATWSAVSNTTVALTALTTGTGVTDWTTVSFTTTVPNDGTAKSLRLTGTFSSAQATGSIIEWSQSSLEIGSVATSFTRAGGTIQGELAACQRYYFRSTSGNAYAFMPAQGVGYNSVTVDLVGRMPVTMRVAPTSVDFSTLRCYDDANALPITNLVISSNQPDATYITATVASGGVQFRPYFLGANNSSTAYLGYSAEL